MEPPQKTLGLRNYGFGQKDFASRLIIGIVGLTSILTTSPSPSNYWYRTAKYSRSIAFLAGLPFRNLN